MRERYQIEWKSDRGLLRAIEPDLDEVREAAPALAEAYNDPHNAAMMTNTVALSAAGVVELFREMRGEGGRPFLLFHDGALAGDADLRHVEEGGAEFAFMIGARSAQGRGLGTRFGLMMMGFAFAVLGIERMYAVIIPKNAASLRAFEKMGFVPDATPAARRYAEAEDDVTVSIARAAFEAHHAEVLRELRWTKR
jgi:RimJ/RimL family protein N-acetyltransferase